MALTTGWVRGASVAAFLAQLAALWFPDTGPRDIGALVVFGCLCSGLLLPLLAARRSKPRLNLALLAGLGLALFLAAWIMGDVFSATNSTAALGLMLLPVFQWPAILLATAVGFAAEADRNQA